MSSNSISIRIGVAVLATAAAAACGSDSGSEPTPVVTSVTASIAPLQSGSGGPFTFAGTVTATGATAVSYRWELSNGDLQELQSLQFGGSGSLTTTFTYSPLKTCLGADQQMWARLSILDPNVIDSAKVNFTRNCMSLPL